MRMICTASFLALFTVGVIFVALAPAQRGPGGRGPQGDLNFEEDRDTFHYLLEKP